MSSSSETLVFRQFLLDAEGGVFSNTSDSSDFLFRVFGDAGESTALACSYGGGTVWPISSSSESSQSDLTSTSFAPESSDSDDSDDIEVKDLTFCVLRSLDSGGGEFVFLTGEGTRIATYPLSIDLGFTSMAFWPGNSSRIVAIKEKSVYVVDFIDEGVVTSEFSTSYTLTGIASPTSITSDQAKFYFSTNDQGLIIAGINANPVTFSLDSLVSDSLPANSVALSGSEAGIWSFHSTRRGGAIPYEYDGVSHIQCSRVGVGVTDSADIVQVTGKITAPSQSEPSAITREYNSGIAEETDGVFFGPVAPGQVSDTKVVDLRVEGVNLIRNVKIGIVDQDRGLTTSDTWLVSHGDSINSSSVPEDSFQGVNSDSTPGNANNYSIGTKEDASGLTLESDYVHLAAQAPFRFLGAGHCTYRWFFDFEGGNISEDMGISIYETGDASSSSESSS